MEMVFIKRLHPRPRRDMCCVHIYEFQDSSSLGYLLSDSYRGGHMKISLHGGTTESILCAVIYLRSYLNNIQINKIFCGRISHSRIKSKSVFYRAGCGTSGIHYGLREGRCQESHSELQWQKMKSMENIVPMIKSEGAIFL